MSINSHVPLYETCLKLKELGFRQAEHFYWEVNPFGPSLHPQGGSRVFIYIYSVTDNIYPAPLLSEILETEEFQKIDLTLYMCPDYKNPGLDAEGKLIKFFRFFDGNDIGNGFSGEDRNPVEAAAQLWVKIKTSTLGEKE